MQSSIVAPDPNATNYEYVWTTLRQVKTLHIPMGISETPGDRQLTANEDDLWFLIDRIFFQAGEQKMGLVFTDQAFLREWTQHIAVETLMLLRRFFEDNHVDGLLFNQSCAESHDQNGMPNFSHETQSVFSLPRVVLPKVIGMLMSQDPQSTRGLEHARMGDLALRADNPYVAFYHADIAKEDTATLKEAMPTLIAALLDLGLLNEARDFIQYALQSRVEERDLYFHNARYLTLSGQPEKAFEQIHDVSHSDLEPLAHLERGRAFIAMHDFESAQRALRRSLELEADNYSAELLMGISLRNQHYGSGDPHGLAQAKLCFEKVLLRQGYHASQAYHHLCTVYFAQKKFEKAKNYAERCLRFRDHAPARRNLILCLYALGKLDEAKTQARLQRVRHPDEKPILDQYGF